MRRILLSTLLLLTPSLALDAQTPGRAAPLLELAPGARATGLGGAAQLGVADSDHLFAHPAFLGSGGFRLSGSVIDAGATLVSVSTSQSAFGGRVGLGVRAAEWDGVAPVTAPGGLDGFLDGGRAGGDVGRSTVAATVGYVRDAPFDLLDLEVGVTATLLSERVDGDRDRTVSLDVGLGRDVGPFDVALSARNMGADLDLPDGTTTTGGTALPTRYELGAGAYGRQLGPLDLGVAGRVGIRDDDELVYGGGLEFGYYPIQGRTFVVRVGGQNVPEGEGSPLTLGGTFRGDDLVLDWAWRDVDGTAVHVITIGWR